MLENHRRQYADQVSDHRIAKTPRRLVVKVHYRNVRSRGYGDTVILIGIVITEWKQNDKPMTDRSRYTDTYVKRNGKWQVVASHLSNAAQ